MNDMYNNHKLKRILLRISSVLMLLAALPMLLWCWGHIGDVALNHTSSYAGVGYFLAGVVYVFSMVTAIAGLVFAGQCHRYRWCRILGYIQLVAGVLLIVPLGSYFLLALPPLFLLSVLYLFGVGWRKKRNCSQQQEG